MDLTKEEKYYIFCLIRRDYENSVLRDEEIKWRMKLSELFDDDSFEQRV